MYQYDLREDPAAPYLPVQLTNPSTGVSIRVPAKLDSGAAISVLPQHAVGSLALEPVGDVAASGYDRQVMLLPTYDVTFGIESYTLPDFEVTVSPRQDLLLGRDVLNRFIVVLNGKDLTFELRDP